MIIGSKIDQEQFKKQAETFVVRDNQIFQHGHQAAKYNPQP